MGWRQGAGSRRKCQLAFIFLGDVQKCRVKVKLMWTKNTDGGMNACVVEEV